jgi:hypothetical protein
LHPVDGIEPTTKSEPQQPQKQEFTMKKFILAAIAALSLGIGSAYAAQPMTNHLGQVIWGPDYDSDATGG